jgi:hypothetical protein
MTQSKHFFDDRDERHHRNATVGWTNSLPEGNHLHPNWIKVESSRSKSFEAKEHKKLLKKWAKAKRVDKQWNWWNSEEKRGSRF